MQMRMVCVDGLVISLTQVVRGEVGMQFRPNQECQLDVSEDIANVLTGSGRLAYSDRLDGFVTYITNFPDIEGVISFFEQWEFKTRVVTHDEFKLVPKPSAS